MHQKPVPTVGRVVHFVPRDTPKQDAEANVNTAVIAQVIDPDAGLVTLFVIDPIALRTYFVQGAEPASEPTPGKWHWPLIVAASPAASVP